MRRGALTALAVVAALAAAGCAKGTEQKEYATPAALCGVTVDPAVLRPVLVPGKEVAVSLANAPSGGTGCAVSVDGKRVLALENTPGPASLDYRATWTWQMPHGTAVGIGDEGRATDTLVSAARRCTVGTEKAVFVSRAERFTSQGGDAAARKEALTRFMTAYFPAAQKAAGCTA
ncbi:MULTISPECIES: hypothetical protein [unclassified Streptomyces]|uniref:hypothetical protein n=1 Tax=unclassified Streptomyces TaxID=2593676 RepID=UPI002E330ED6|nr:hypothetical protein [Streptomyces sp. NBC_01268]